MVSVRIKERTTLVVEEGTIVNIDESLLSSLGGRVEVVTEKKTTTKKTTKKADQ